MSGLIDSLKARRAGIAGMLNPGKTGKFGNGLLLNSSSLQPQTIFRQLKASFSVKRPSVTVMREKSLELFSKKTESKYNSGMSLLHLKPASYSSSPSSTIQRSPTSMPLPVSGGTAGIQLGNNGSVSVPSNTVSSMPSYPAPSERRPVVFDRSDGPSDFEKRLMAAKKQKQETEAKQKGPDRRRVRTERVEISPSSSKDEVNRDFSPFDVPEPPVPPIVKNDRTVRDSSKSDRSSVSRQMDTVSTQRVESQKTTSTIETRVARRPGNVISREYAPAKQKSENEIRRELLSSAESVQDSTQEAGKQAKVITAGIETIQREPAKSAEPVQVSAHETEKQVEAVLFRDETIQRESLKAAEPVQASSHEMEKQAEVVQLRNETIQRESQKPAGPVQVPFQESEKPVETVQSQNGTIQRDPLGDGEPVHVQNKNTKKTSHAATNQSKAIQREPLDTAEDVRVGTVDNEKNAEKVSSPSEMIQREPLKMTEPVHEELKQAENHKKGAEEVTSPSGMIQREPLKMAEPVHEELDQAENHEKGAEAITSPSEMIQREPLKAAELVREQPGQAENMDIPAETKTNPSETIQREPLKAAEPIREQPGQAENTAETKTNPSEMIQREPLKAAEPIREQPGQAENTAVTKTNPSEMIQREPLKAAEPIREQPGQAENTAVTKTNPSEMIQREPLKMADTVLDQHGQTESTETSVDAITNPSETIQRESLKVAEPIREQREQTENHEKGAEPITSPSETVFREPLKAAKPIRVQTENHENGAEAIPSETIQREPIKSAKPVHIQNDLHTEDNPVPPEMIQRAYLKTAEPLQYDSDKAVTEMPVIQRIFTDEPTHQKTEKTAVSAHNENSVIQRQMIQSMDHLPENIDGVNNSLSPIDERSNVIQREIIKRAEPLSDSEISQKNADNTVQREISTAGGDLQSLLSTLPTHYEMPKEQIEAIRSGKNISSQNSSIQREYGRIPSDINQQSKKEDHISAISTQNEIQRTVDFVLPKPPEKSKGSGSVSEIQRESVKKDQPAMMSFSFPTSMGQLPGANSENRSSRNYQNNDYPGDSDFSGASGSDTIQRELDTKSSEKSGKTTDSTDFGFLFSDKEKEEIKKESPKVTPRELEILADRLLPRIKRIMRSEMERSIFR